MNLRLPETRQGRFKLLATGAIVIVLAFFIVRALSGPDTVGDVAAKDSPAFLVYKDRPYDPTGNVHTDSLIRQDAAYFARQKFKEYDPDVRPAVVYKINKVSKTQTGETVLAGTYEHSKDKVEIRFKPAANERITNSIKNLKTGVTMDAELPSSSKFNTFIKTLPQNKGDYIIDYVRRDGSVDVTLGDASPRDLQNAKAFMAQTLGVPVADLAKYPIGYTFPTNFDDTIPPDEHD
jgi:hypothetical protein